MNKINSEEQAEYSTTTTMSTREQNEVIVHALAILASRIKKGDALTSPLDVKNYLQITLANRECEYFGCLFLDNRHRVIEFVEVFRGTIDGAAVYPREVVKESLRHNAAAVILAHNHPSGVATPSQADKDITRRLKEALALVDIRVLDHLIVGDGEPFSFAEEGLI